MAKFILIALLMRRNQHWSLTYVQHPELLRVSNSPPGANARKYRATTTFSTTRPRRLVDRLVLAWIPRSTEHFSSLFKKRILSFRAIICLRLLSNLMPFDNIPDWWIDPDGRSWNVHAWWWWHYNTITRKQKAPLILASTFKRGSSVRRRCWKRVTRNGYQTKTRPWNLWIFNSSVFVNGAAASTTRNRSFWWGSLIHEH